ncbi:MAG: GAF domain-containing protein [Anaerolineae bacterium]|nr:GAF domain-containing protein [Anaerolineae bacterium]
MNPVVLLVLFTANLLTLALTLSVLLLALWQHPGEAVGRTLIQFLAIVGFYNLSVMLLMAGTILAYPPVVEFVTVNLSITGFLLSVVGAFSLVITLAGKMKQAFQVIARSGVVVALVLQWPLWNGGFFSRDVPYHLMADYTPAGLVGMAAAVIYIGMTLGAAWVYRRRIDQPLILGSIALLLIGQLLTLVNPTLREIGLPSLISAVVSAALGYSLVRMQLFTPLMMQTAQLTAIRDISRALMRTTDLPQLLNTISQQARRVLNADLAVILTLAKDGLLVISAQDGSTTNIVGRTLSVGDGLSGRVFEMQQPIRLENYHLWEGRSPAFLDIPLHASLGVPLISGNDVVGVLAVHHLESGRLFSDRDQAVLELIAPQAAIAIANARLRQINAQRTSLVTPPITPNA